MPDERRHRGPHPEDAELFASDRIPTLQRASSELGWLLDRGYPVDGSLKLVGDRHALRARQRLAIKRCACTAEQRDGRQSRRVLGEALRDEPVWLDGFNVVTTVEAALSGGVLIVGRDGVVRDMASMHGHYRRVSETRAALTAIADTLAAHETGPCRWLLDAPVSNSGRLREAIADLGRERGLDWAVEVVRDPDPLLIGAGEAVVASADSQVLDGARRAWWLANDVVDGIDGTRPIDLGTAPAADASPSVPPRDQAPPGRD